MIRVFLEEANAPHTLPETTRVVVVPEKRFTREDFLVAAQNGDLHGLRLGYEKGLLSDSYVAPAEVQLLVQQNQFEAFKAYLDFAFFAYKRHGDTNIFRTVLRENKLEFFAYLCSVDKFVENELEDSTMSWLLANELIETAEMTAFQCAEAPFKTELLKNLRGATLSGFFRHFPAEAPTRPQAVRFIRYLVEECEDLEIAEAAGRFLESNLRRFHLGELRYIAVALYGIDSMALKTKQQVRNEIDKASTTDAFRVNHEVFRRLRQSTIPAQQWYAILSSPALRGAVKAGLLASIDELEKLQLATTKSAPAASKKF